MSSAIYVNAKKDITTDKKQKTFSEIEFLDNKFTKLFNMMNGIDNTNYNITIEEVPKTSSESSNKESSNSEKESGQESDQSKSSDSNSQSSDNQSANSENSSEKDEKYNLKLDGILTSNEEINWENVKGEVEILYSSIPTITLDLYKVNVNKDDILNFNKEYDNLIAASKNTNKEEFLGALDKIYEYMPKFVQNASNNEQYKVIIETKKNIFNAYSKLDTEDWGAIADDIKRAIDEYSKLLTNNNLDTSKKHSIDKGYIILNEIQNAIEIKDKSVFLIKYKNLLEEINNM